MREVSDRTQLFHILVPLLSHLADGLDARDVVAEGAVCDARDLGVGFGPPELLLGNLLVGDGLDNVGTGNEHVGGVLDHENEVCHGRGVDGWEGRDEEGK